MWLLLSSGMLRAMPRHASVIQKKEVGNWMMDEYIGGQNPLFLANGF